MFEIKIDTTKLNKIKALLNKAMRGQKGFVARVVAEYFLGTESRGLRHYALWKKVTRRAAYGKTFFSNKQRAAFFAKLKGGGISVPYHRTGKQGKAWHIEGSSTKVRVANNDPSTSFTRGQTRLHDRMGWMTIKEVIKSNLTGALRAGKAAFNQWLQGLK